MTERRLISIDTQALVTLPFTTDLLTGQLRDSSRAMYARDIAAYLDFAGSAEAALDAATFARWRGMKRSMP